MSAREVQASGGFLFHFSAKRIALDVARESRIQPRHRDDRQRSHDEQKRDRLEVFGESKRSALSRSRPRFACAPQCDQRRLLFSRVADFHRFGFLAAAVLVPLEDVMIFVGHL
jgi:hypothetical protein